MHVHPYNKGLHWKWACPLAYPALFFISGVQRQPFLIPLAVSCGAYTHISQWRVPTVAFVDQFYASLRLPILVDEIRPCERSPAARPHIASKCASAHFYSHCSGLGSSAGGHWDPRRSGGWSGPTAAPASQESINNPLSHTHRGR